MTKKLLFVFTYLVACAALAQPGKEAWHWVFGRASSLDFSSGSPVPGVANNLGTGEGSACYSDPATGQFIFGAMATIVFNKNFAIMNNGITLYGNSSTTQSDLIIPKPHDPNIFYVITADAAGPTNKGVHYSVVDISQQGGLGKVILKNQVLTPPPCTEKLVGAKHCNGKDYWILTHPLNSDAFYAYLVTSSGINTTPVISHAGTSHTKRGIYYEEGIGYMKVSPNGKKIAVGLLSDSIPILEILDFNNFTGVVSNPITINYGPSSAGPYGLSFSPDNTKLYAAPMPDDSSAIIYQYDITSNSLPSILASQVQLAAVHLHPTSQDPYANQVGAFQMGPDGKIYISMSTDSLSVINNPNSAGLSCNFQMNGLPIVPIYYTYSFGLPNFIDANGPGMQMSVPDVRQCNTFTTTTLDAGPGFASYQWSTGVTTETIAINAPGQYWITVTNSEGCQRTDTVNAYLVKSAKLDTMVCDTFHINLSQPGAQSFVWYDSSGSAIKNITQSGSYYADINFSSGCAIRDSFDVAVVSSPHVDLGPSNVVCRADLKLNVNYPAVTYTWSTGVSTPSLTINQPGKYWITIQDTNGCKGSDTVDVEPGLLAYTFVMPNIVTPNDDKINDEIDFGEYQFSFFQIEIYNRWGQKLFSGDDPNVVWKPTEDDGTYFYAAKYRIDCWGDAQTKSIKGFITIVR